MDTHWEELEGIKPSKRRRFTNGILPNGLVNISAICSSVLTWVSMMFPLSTWSLKKWCLTSICLVLEWWTGFLETFIAEVLSHLISKAPRSILKSPSCCFNQRSWEAQAAAAIYSASVVESAIQFCFLDPHDTKQGPRNCAMPLVDLRSTKKPA